MLGGIDLHTITAAVRRALASLTFLQSGTGAKSRTWADKIAEHASVKDFGAVGDGVADDTAAFTAALATGRGLFVPNGTYLVSNIALLSGQNGRTIRGETRDGAIIKGKAASTHIIDVNVAPPNEIRGLVLDNFTLDMSAMADLGTNCALYLGGSYLNTYSNLKFTGNGSNKRSVLTQSKALQTTWINCDFGAGTGIIEFVGVSASADAVTTQTFIGCSFANARLTHCLAFTFLQPIIQGNYDKFTLTDVQGLTIIGGDVEGTGTYLNCVSGVIYVTSQGNNITGATYIAGTITGQNLRDYGTSTRWAEDSQYGTTITDFVAPTFATSKSGVANMVNGVATTLYTMVDDPGTGILLATLNAPGNQNASVFSLAYVGLAGGNPWHVVLAEAGCTMTRVGNAIKITQAMGANYNFQYSFLKLFGKSAQTAA